MKMRLQFGLESGKYCKRQFRWMFQIPNVIGDKSSDPSEIKSLPPEKSSRPSIDFKEIEIKHFIEDYYIPGKPSWKPVTITVWDLKTNKHPIMEWLKKIYNPKVGLWNPTRQSHSDLGKDNFIKKCSLKLYDGCGTTVEEWIWEDAWPSAVNFQSLEMGSTGIVMCEITLRYARAYIESPDIIATGGPLA
jgi:hypothetical protein